MAAPDRPVSLDDKFGLVAEHWSPRVVGEFNDVLVKVVKAKGEFVWHKHDEMDEIFLVTKGKLTIKLHDGDVVVAANEFFVVPKGTEHCPAAHEECELLLFEPAGVVNTGDAAPGDLTAPADPWI
ncbi:MAG TPA: cupin domain-containing protein [Acidimicrobiia bacterium]|nr:cupin domain-containing protein [Acidimicrobiia bacterium]